MTQRKVTRLLSLLLLGSTLSGCIKLDIDERTVFRPQPSSKVATKVSDLGFDGNVQGTQTRAVHGFLRGGEGRIAYSYVSKAGENRPLVVQCYGNASERRRGGAAYVSKAIEFADVLIFDYPGYGDSGGTANAAGLEAMLPPLNGLAKELSSGRPIIYWGHSIGGFVCARLAGQADHVDGFIFETSARNVDEVADAWTPWFAKPFTRIKIAPSLKSYDSALELKNVSKPILVLGAGKDEVLPVKLSRSLSQALIASGRTTTYVELPTATHNAMASDPGFRPAVAAYFQSLTSNSTSKVQSQ